MTETEWLSGTNPTLMVYYLSRSRRLSKVRERHLTLFACACCRRVSDALPAEVYRRALEVGERSADGLTTDQERSLAWSALHETAEEEGISGGKGYDYYFAELVDWGHIPGALAFRALLGLVGSGRVEAEQMAADAASEAAWNASRAMSGDHPSEVAYEEALALEQAAQCRLLREIVPNPFRQVAIDPTWLAGNARAVQRLAQDAYDHHAFDLLPILADALEDAGCSNRLILDHCRGPGPHFGCVRRFGRYTAVPMPHLPWREGLASTNLNGC